MGSKRPYSDVDASMQSQNASNKKRKHLKSHKAEQGSGAQAVPSLNVVKKRARTIERRFAKGDDLRADVQQKLERELAQCRRQIEDLQHRKKRSDMISKYHKVRFFERRKAERLRKQLQRRIEQATDPEEIAQIKADLHIADVDWHYTRYFPFMERYISLYPVEKSTKDESDGQPAAMRALHSERPHMWTVMEETMGKGQKALEALQERRPEKTTTGAAADEGASRQSSGEKSGSKAGKSKKDAGLATGKHGHDRNRQRRGKGEGGHDEASGYDSDGSGFFD